MTIEHRSPLAEILLSVSAIVLFAGILYLGSGDSKFPFVPEDEQVFCTQEAKLCPDGSYVGRTGPQCEFAACPNADVPLPMGYTLERYAIETITDVACTTHEQCETPAEYLLQSRCPFVSRCIESKCAVVCPSFMDTIEAYVRRNISALSSVKEQLGGTFYVTAFEAQDGVGTVQYEDGHNAYAADFTYETDADGNLSVTSWRMR